MYLCRAYDVLAPPQDGTCEVGPAQTSVPEQPLLQRAHLLEERLRQTLQRRQQVLNARPLHTQYLIPRSQAWGFGVLGTEAEPSRWPSWDSRGSRGRPSRAEPS